MTQVHIHPTSLPLSWLFSIDQFESFAGNLLEQEEAGSPLDGLQGYLVDLELDVIRQHLVGQDEGFHLVLPLLVLNHQDFEEVGGDGHMVGPDHFVLDVLLPI